MCRRSPTAAVVIHAAGDVTVKWRLRPGLLWSDGQPLTCDDYSFTNQWILDPANTGLAAGKTGYLTRAGLQHYLQTGKTRPSDINLTVSCLSPTRMVWDFAEPYAAFLSLLPHPLPRHYMASIPIADAVTGEGYLVDQLRHAPVSGPFRFYRVTPGKGMRLSRNPHYSDHLTGGPAYLRHIRLHWYADASAIIQTYRKHPTTIDVGLGLDDSAPGMYELDGLHDVVTDPSSVYELLAPNWAAGHRSVALQPIRGGACPMHDRAGSWRSSSRRYVPGRGGRIRRSCRPRLR